MGFLAAVFFTTLSIASDLCGTVDMRDRFGPARNQGEIGWCYAFAGADWLGAEIGLKPPAQISAFHMAGTTATASLSKIKLAHQQIDGYGDRTLERDLSVSAGRKGQNLLSRVEGSATLMGPVALFSGKNIYREHSWPSERKSGLTPKAERIFGMEADFIGRQALLREQELFSEIFPEGCEEEGFQFTLDVTPIGAVNDWIARQVVEEKKGNCRLKVKVPELKLVEADFSRNRRQGLVRLNQLIGRKKPVIMGYDVCKVMGSGNEGPCKHASVVVGRRFNKAADRCEYLVRNSYGDSCEGYSEGIECEAGHFWMPASRMVESLDRLGWSEEGI